MVTACFGQSVRQFLNIVCIPMPQRPPPPVGQGLLISPALRHTAFVRTPLDDRSVRRRDLYLAAHKNQKRQKCMTPEGFEPAIPPSEPPQPNALDRPTIWIGVLK